MGLVWSGQCGHGQPRWSLKGVPFGVFVREDEQLGGGAKASPLHTRVCTGATPFVADCSCASEASC